MAHNAQPEELEAVDRNGSAALTDPHPPTALPAEDYARDHRWTPAKIAIWATIALLGGLGWVMLALVRGEHVNGIWFVFASVCTYLIGYRFYSKYI